MSVRFNPQVRPGTSVAVMGAVIDRAEEFIWLNGRVLEQRRYERRFRSGTADGVMSALLAYRRADGGFGYGVEPDVRGPASLARAWFTDAEIDRCLTALLAEQEADGGWPIRWRQWAQGPVHEWRPWVTLRALTVLRAYGRI